MILVLTKGDIITSLEKKGDVQDDAGLKDDFDALVEAVKFFQSLFD